MISKNILKILACPQCKGEVELEDDYIICNTCQIKFRVEDDIPVMLLEESEPL